MTLGDLAVVDFLPLRRAAKSAASIFLGFPPMAAIFFCFGVSDFATYFLPPFFFLQAPLHPGFEHPQPHDLHIVIYLSS